MAGSLTEGFRSLEAYALKKIIGLEFLLLFLTLLSREELDDMPLSPCAASPQARKQGDLVRNGILLLSQTMTLECIICFNEVNLFNN